MTMGTQPLKVQCIKIPVSKVHFWVDFHMGDIAQVMHREKAFE